MINLSYCRSRDVHPHHSPALLVAGLVARNVLVIVWLWAAAGKLRDMPGFVRASRDLLPQAMHAAVPVAARLLPVLEVVVAVALLVDALALVGSALTCALLVFFTAVLLRAHAAGVITTCACFGTRTATRVGALTVFRTALLLVLALALFATQLVLTVPFDDLSATQRLFAGLIASLVVATASVVAGAVQLLTTVEADIRRSAHRGRVTAL